MVKLSKLNSLKWQVSEDLETLNLDNLVSEEQELHLNVMRAGTNGKPEVLVSCGYGRWITKLSKSSLFTLERIYTNREGLIILVEGKLDPKGLTIRRGQSI